MHDHSTALLIGRFYEGYIGSGLTPSAALRAAQLWLRDASLDDLLATLSRWGETGRISSAKVMMGNLEKELRGRKTARNLVPAEETDEAAAGAPFASPIYWGGFVHYGV